MACANALDDLHNMTVNLVTRSFLEKVIKDPKVFEAARTFVDRIAAFNTILLLDHEVLAKYNHAAQELRENWQDAFARDWSKVLEETFDELSQNADLYRQAVE